MSDTRRTYSNEYKLDVLELCLTSGKSMAQTERELGLPRHTVGRWRRSALLSVAASNRRGQLGRPPSTGEELSASVIAFLRNEMTRERKQVTPIWTRLPFNPDWVQYFGYTLFGEGTYRKTGGLHSGVDLGVYANRFKDGEFRVCAGCRGKILSIEKGGSYSPAYVNVIADGYPTLRLIYGHLNLDGVALDPGQVVEPDTTLGYLDVTEYHVHLEIRRRDPQAQFIHPWRYLAHGLQDALSSFADTSKGTRFVEGLATPYTGSY